MQKTLAARVAPRLLSVIVAAALSLGSLAGAGAQAATRHHAKHVTHKHHVVKPGKKAHKPGHHPRRAAAPKAAY